MAENTQERVAGNLTRNTIAEMLAKNFQRLPDREQKLLTHGPLFLATNASLAGLIANSLYRRALNVTRGVIASSLPMAVLPFMTTFTLYSGVVSNPLLLGDLNCPSCVLLRGALVGVVGGAVYPVLLALPINLGFAVLHSTIVKPEKGNTLRYCVDVSRPVLRKMRVVMVIQALFGTYLSSRNFETYHKLAQMAFDSDKEELLDENVLK
ncbi:transmembrane protein 126A [Brachionichthys hirsutus]|uniref:transmembrane protein 126A n=1 Tax=Brachionichthys hirsutus TaxID=412623 RepID=UPI0036043026